MRKWLLRQVQPPTLIAMGLFVGVATLIGGARRGSWVLIAIAVVFFALAWVGWVEAAARYRQDQRDLDLYTGRCPVCRYDLTGNVTGVCPECGTKRP